MTPSACSTRTSPTASTTHRVWPSPAAANGTPSTGSDRQVVARFLHRLLRSLFAFHKTNNLGGLARTGKGRKTAPQQLAIGFFDHTGVTHHQHTPVAFRAYQATGPLLERNGCFGQLVL